MARKKAKYRQKEEGFTGEKIKVDFSKVRGAGLSVPFFWEDEAIVCRICKRKFVMTARLKQQWYEIEQRNANVRPVRCKRCSERHSELLSRARHLEQSAPVREMAQEQLEEVVRVLEELSSMREKCNRALLLSAKKRLAELP